MKLDELYKKEVEMTKEDIIKKAQDEVWKWWLIEWFIGKGFRGRWGRREWGRRWGRKWRRRRRRRERRCKWWST